MEIHLVRLKCRITNLLLHKVAKNEFFKDTCSVVVVIKKYDKLDVQIISFSPMLVLVVKTTTNLMYFSHATSFCHILLVVAKSTVNKMYLL